MRARTQILSLFFLLAARVVLAGFRARSWPARSLASRQSKPYCAPGLKRCEDICIDKDQTCCYNGASSVCPEGYYCIGGGCCPEGEAGAECEPPEAPTTTFTSPTNTVTSPTTTPTTDTNGSAGGHGRRKLSRSDQIALGIGLGCGISTIVVGILAWLCPRTRARWSKYEYN